MKVHKAADPPARPRRILIVDDHPIMRYGLAQLIRQEPALEVCGEMNDAQSALEATRDLKPDLVLADLTMPGKNGLELIKEIKAFCPTVAVLVISIHDETAYAERVLRAGGNGYLMKSAGGQRLLEAVRRVLAGGVYLSDDMSTHVLGAFAGRRSAGSPSTLSVLTEREFQVLELMGQAMTTQEIAAFLRISPKTVETHRAHIVSKLRYKRTSDLAKFAIRWAQAQDLA